MLLHNKLQKDYTLNQSGYQLKLPLELGTIIPKNDSVRLLSQFVEEMDLTDLYSTYDRINSLSPRTLLKIVLYSYMNGDYSSRSMELNCKRDINFMFLLEGHPAPDHATLARFRSIHFAPCSKRILAEVSNILFDLGEISGETIFIDGTKIEANANKYTFVWKKAVTKNQAKLLIKLADFVAECEQLYDIKIAYGNVIKIKHLKRLRKKLYALKNAGNITFVHGIGKRKTPLQKSIEALEEALSKLKEYTQKIHICGERNSYSKTDNDATFMRMKEDAMGNGQLKPAFNLQQGNNCKTPLGERTKVLQVAKTFIKHRKEDLERIISDEGVLYRMNRSILKNRIFIGKRGWYPNDFQSLKRQPLICFILQTQSLLFIPVNL